MPEGLRFPLASSLILLLLGLDITVAQSGAPELPHVSQCNFCSRCHTQQPTQTAARRRALSQDNQPSSHLLTTPDKAVESRSKQQAADVAASAQLLSDEQFLTNDAHASAHQDRSMHLQQQQQPQQRVFVLAADSVGSHMQRMLLQRKKAMSNEKLVDLNTTIAPMRSQIWAKARKPNCTECYGCSAQIQPLQAHTAFGKNFSIEQGASQEWLFTTELPGSGQRAIIKVWCVPYDKIRRTFRWACSHTREAVRAISFLLAQQRVAEECGLLDDVTIKLWVDPVNAVMPSLGFHIWWDGLWMEKADGISLNQMAYLSKQQMRRGNLLSLLQDKLNKTQVINAALYDMLTSQCDRHGQNVFLSETGKMTLIDNLQALVYNWIKCSANSIFLPGTAMNEIIRFGGDLVFKRKGAKPRKSLNPLLLLDYRCYVKDGAIGTNYPPRMAQCLERIRAMSPVEVQQHFQFPDMRMAEILHARAKDMATMGFEYTLKDGLPLNPGPKRYRWHPPCCKMHINDRGSLQCSHEWSAKPEFAFGDPISGGKWTKPYPDPGTFNWENS